VTAAQALAVSKQNALEAMTVINKQLQDLEAAALRNPSDWWVATRAHAIAVDLARIANAGLCPSRGPRGDR